MTPLEIVTNFKQNFLKEIERFVMCYSGLQPHVISALADKMNHMAFNIGSPSSIEGMLKSISKGTIKRWGDYSKVKSNERFTRGVQLRGMHVTQMNRSFETIHKGHFRWNFTAYMVDRETQDYINEFWFNPKFKAKPNKSRIKNVITGRCRMEKTKTSTLYIIETKNHRWTFSNPNNQGGLEVFTTNIGDGIVNTTEMIQLKAIAKELRKNG